MKKIIIAALSLLPFFTSCDKETEDNSFTTHFVDLQLKGDDYVILKVGDTYSEAGFTAEENGEDVSGKVVVVGNVDANTPGTYNILYKVANKDGYEAKAQRKVLVNNPATAEGSFLINASRPGGATYTTILTFTKQANGNYWVSDLLGHWYSDGRGYGSMYSAPGEISIADDGTIAFTGEGGIAEGWGIQANSTDGTFDKSTGVFSFVTMWGGYEFDITSL